MLSLCLYIGGHLQNEPQRSNVCPIIIIIPQCTAGHLRPFRTALHLSRLLRLPLPREYHPISFHSLSLSLSLHSSSRSSVACSVFFSLLVHRSVQFWRCYRRLSTGRVQAISISVLSSSQTMAACGSACTIPHLRFGFSCISMERHPLCSCLQL